MGWLAIKTYIQKNIEKLNGKLEATKSEKGENFLSLALPDSTGPFYINVKMRDNRPTVSE